MARILRSPWFPAYRKTRFGAASQGVRVLLNESQLERAAKRVNFVVQPYLAPPPGLSDRFFDPDEGWPLFHALVADGQFAGQAIIGPNGAVSGGVFCGLNTMIMGRSEYTRPVEDAGFSRTMQRFVQSAADAGWRGPFNVQFRRLADGSYCAFELAGRMTGTTSARRLFNYDEIGLVAKTFADFDLPLGVTGTATAGPGSVTKSLTDFYAPSQWVDRLTREGVWRAPS
jgi:hypothetical protein